MTNYPSQYDTDNELPAIDDNITEWSGEPHNKLREAVLTIQRTLGIDPQGTAGTVADRISVSLNADGTLNPTAIASLGLFSNIVDSQIDPAANITESKLNLAYNTSTLKAMIDVLTSSVSATNVFITNVYNELISHTIGTFGRHEADHIDVSIILNKDGYARLADNVMEALLSINEDLINHLNSTSAHNANFILVENENFSVIPSNVENVQEALDYIDSMGKSIYGEFGALLNSNGIIRVTSTEDLDTDGYHLLQNETLPVETVINLSDSIDDVVKFYISPMATANQLDALFASISVGDYITINYGPYVSTFTINNILFEPQSIWDIKIDGVNLENKTNVDPAYAYIEKKKYNDNVYGNLAVCPVNHNLHPDYNSVPSSVIVVPPKSAQVLGMDLNLTDLDSEHYNLYIDFYPFGNVSKIISLPGIDVTGNQGTSPGQYTLENVIRNVNKGFRAAGYNYRMVAFERLGQFGLAVADYYNNAGFSIRSGIVSGGSLIEDLPKNVIGNNRNSSFMSDVKDALGLGNLKANVASPAYSPTQSAIPTKIFVGKKNKKYNVFGNITDKLAKDVTTNEDGYWFAKVFSQSQNAVTIETTYEVNQDLSHSKIRKGSTIVVLHDIELSDTRYNDYDYGRFVVKNLEFVGCAPDIMTKITVINGISALGLPRENQTPINLPVKIYHCDDSVTFDTRNLSDIGGPEINTKRLYEIFINNKGETCAYERLRLPITGGEISYFTNDNTFGWHVVNVSPKFKGYLDGTTNKRQIRINVSNYNSSNESFELQITNPFSIDSGAIVLGKKDEIIKVYDHTGVDYIEIIFEDQFEGYNIPNTSLDCDVFLTESQNEEFMCLGNCCQTYLASTINGGSVFYIKDKRQFGTINERVLADTAIKFIESNNKLLHENSIINGLDYKEDFNDVLIYNGGIANINGKIISKNSIQFTILPIALYGTNEYNIEIVLCLDDKGNIWWAPLTTDGTFDVLDVPVDVSVPLVSKIKAYPFEYIINNRKDLVPFSIVKITSKIDGTLPVLLNSEVIDVRKFLREAHPNQISVSGHILNNDRTSNITGNFDSIKAAVEYAYAAGMNKPKIVIKGTVVLDEEVVLSDMIIEGGPYNLIKVKENGRLSVLGNVKLDGLKFRREFNNAAINYLDGAQGKGTIVVNCLAQNTYSDIVIENCVFSTKETYSASWVPHILFEQVGGGAAIKNVKISNNTFNETFSQFIIGIINRSGNINLGTVLNGVVIENNKSNHLSVTAINSDANGINNYVGLEAYGLKIHNNIFGELWLNVCRNSWVGADTGNEQSIFSTELIKRNITTTIPGSVDFTKFYNMIPDVSISENNVRLIVSKNINLVDILESNFPSFATPSMKIYKNNLSELHLCINKGDANINVNSFIISENLFFTTDGCEKGIYLLGTVNECTTIINNNIFTNPSSYYYKTAIECYIPCGIAENIINKCIKGPISFGIRLSFLETYLNENSIVSYIKNNVINRGDENIYKYIRIYYEDVIKNIQIVDNIFDHTTTNGSDIDVVEISEDTLVQKLKNRKKIRVSRNINQTFELDLMPYTESNLIFDSLNIGWNHVTYNEYLTVSSLIYLPLVSNGDYELQNLVINIPFIDDALPIELNLSLFVSKPSPGSKDIYLAVYGCSNDEGNRIINTSISFDIVPNNFIMSTPSVSQDLTINLQNLYIGLGAYESYTIRNSIPISLFFYSSNAYSDFLVLNKNTTFEQIQIRKILATYRY